MSPKQQVLLLQVGRRVVVIGDGGGAGMRPLCEITDPDEVAALVGDLKSADAAIAPARSFGTLFKRAADPFADDVADPSVAGAGTGPARPVRLTWSGCSTRSAGSASSSTVEIRRTV